MARLADDCFHHHHRAVDHHSEVQCSQGEKVGRNVAQIEKDGREQQGERNGERDNEGSTNIEQKQEKDDADQKHAFGQIVHHRVQGEMEQIAAIQHRHHLHPGRQDSVVQLIDFLMNTCERGLFLGTFAHQDAALDHIRLVDNHTVFHVIGPSHVTQTDFRTLHHLRNILDTKGGTGLGFQYGIFNVVDIAEEPESAHVHLLHADFNEAAAGVHIVNRQLLLHLADAQPVRNQFVWVHAHLVLAHRTAEVGNVDHVGHGFELLEQNPIFEGP